MCACRCWTEAILPTLKEQKTEVKYDFGIDDGALADALDRVEKSSDLTIVHQQKKELEVVLDQSIAEEKYQAHHVVLLQSKVACLESTIRGLKTAVKSATKRVPELKSEVSAWKAQAQKWKGDVDWFRGQVALAQMG